MFCIGMIVAGIVGLKLLHRDAAPATAGVDSAEQQGVPS
jgi:hypothetical protein